MRGRCSTCVFSSGLVASSLFLFCLVAVAPAQEAVSLGHREDTVIVGGDEDQCGGTEIWHHDMSFENGYGWQYGGCQPPYYGSFGEGFDVGPAIVECGLYWFTNIGYYLERPFDAYLWAGGVAGPPSEVLWLYTGIQPHTSYWPSCQRNAVEIGVLVDGDFTIGYWPAIPGDFLHWYCCADENGPGGHPWTCIAPGIGYPTGWHHPNVVFEDCASMGIGATVIEICSPPACRTWGEMKALFD